MTSLDVQHRPNRSRSESWYDRACASIAGGLGHDVRHAAPYPLYIERAEGAYKWDAHAEADIDETVAAFDEIVRELVAGGRVAELA